MKTQPVKVLKAHVAINVKDVRQSVEFYRKMFGIEPLKVRTGYAKFDLSNPPLNFTLNETHFSGRGALSHMGIQVNSTEDVLAVRQRWTREGLIPRDEMQTECCYALQDKAWVHDPDGNEWEVFVVLKDNLPEKTAPEQGAGQSAAGQSAAGSAEDRTSSEKTCCTPTCCAPAEAAKV